MSDLKISVVGAGVIGLTTAIELRKNFGNARIDIVADKFYNATTSYVSAGLFLPDAGKTDSRTKKWVKDSFDYWDNLKRSNDSRITGVRDLSGYFFSRIHPHYVQNAPMAEVVPIYRPVEPDELNLCPGGWKYGSYTETLQTDQTKYLRYATNKLLAEDVSFIERKIQKFSELNEYDVIVNCTGVEAKFLCEDKNIYPLRGQVSIVSAPWVKKFYYGEHDTYIIPSIDNIILGGCRQFDFYDKSVNQHDGRAIRERCYNLIPSLKSGELLEQRVGLRPYRTSLRVEADVLDIGGRAKRIVHHYGHGQYGVTMAPGTSQNAVDLVKELITTKITRNKL